MSLLIESIKIENNRVKNIKFHNERYNRARYELFGIRKPIQLRNYINTNGLLPNRVYKCRIIYNTDIQSIEYIEYKIKFITKLKLINVSQISYEYKYRDRSMINNLYDLKESNDDILICLNGVITDTSYANVAFFDGSNWFTPSDPLLRGTARARYLEKRMITEAIIYQKDLEKYQKIRIFNALINFGDIELNTSQINCYTRGILL